MKTITPLGDRVTVKIAAAEEKTTAGGLVIPAGSDNEVTHGVVLAVGPGRFDAGNPGVLQPVPVAVGQKVAYSRYGGTKFETDDGTVILLAVGDLLGIIED